MADAPKDTWLASLTSFCTLLNHWLEGGGNHDVSFSDVYDAIEQKNLFEMLEKKIPGFDVMGVWKSNTKQMSALTAVLAWVAEYRRGSERRKLAVEEGGLSLLMALALEAIADGLWTKD